ncbi:ethanolamine ammonia-lyase subunit EutC [Methylobacterium gnaphalii]|uniref:Ethanolamine ammonia-lyase small subunit n=1 Tax=Methylobacterium gnaphalii TaxID=1010610 RepID=A0A512JKL1_9HYPH|nr:ethanolamine ammonia-lyase subunit EutC [Methylobacterium gnaphalii]GEP10498.1 ethanolamine ammonia-lyase light chain [Methylobacterium gnaphalii]GJD69275.1 Ethanolamine ammonia-lyase light chain [Methylobacterium gnaphalii]GLS47938.1 ethanolamine ammonia-lyase light chain [Methylobacterium gnaphalii]
MSDEDLWRRLSRLTPARIGLGRAGAGLPTREVLSFGLAHAQARDAVHAPLDAVAVVAAIEGLGFSSLTVASQAADRAAYLRRPDHGRRLSEVSEAALKQAAGEPVDLAIVVADGLSARAVHEGAAALLVALKPLVQKSGWSLAPVVIALQARVALGDAVGEFLKARAVAVLIGERPGLSSPDSLGVYLTFAPRHGRSDAERNCISNIRPAGLSYELAAFKLHWLIEQALTRGLTGVNLKDESDAALEAPEMQAEIDSPR